MKVDNLYIPGICNINALRHLNLLAYHQSRFILRAKFQYWQKASAIYAKADPKYPPESPTLTTNFIQSLDKSYRKKMEMFHYTVQYQVIKKIGYKLFTWCIYPQSQIAAHLKIMQPTSKGEILLKRHHNYNFVMFLIIVLQRIQIFF